MGSITSLGVGSGLDLNGLLDQLRSGEQQKLKPIESKIYSEKEKISAYGKLEGALSKLQDASEALSSSLTGDDIYSGLSANVSGDSAVAAASSDAVVGDYNISVNQLASNGSLASIGTGDTTSVIATSEQKLILNFGDSNRNTEVTIEANSSLADIRNAINADKDAGVNATIINDGENYRLALNSRESGSDASIENFTFSGDANNSISADENAKFSGEDASLKVNGINITSSNNQIEDAIQGVTLNLKEIGDSEIRIEQDTEAITEAVNNFVESYNSLKETTSSLTSYNAETDQAGQLNGDSLVRTIESQLRSLMGGNQAGSDLSNLSDLGISTEKDGTLTIDEDKLGSIITSKADEVSKFFSGVGVSDGFASRIEDAVGQILSDNGALQGSIDGAENRIESLNDRYDRMGQSVDRTISRYRAQFSQLDGMIAQMNQTSSYLAQQFNALNNI